MTFSTIEPLEARIAPATLTISDPAPAEEGQSGTHTVTFTATLDEALDHDIAFTFATFNGTAVAGSDYVAKSQQATIAAGSDTATFSVTVNGDAGFEPTESFFVNVTGVPSDVQVANSHPVSPAAQATARAYILNDDIQALAKNRIQWIDVDGDLVTLTISKGSLLNSTGTALAANVGLIESGALGGRQLQSLVLTDPQYAGASVSVIATKQTGFPPAPIIAAPNGRVDVGFIDAATFNASELQVVGNDLGAVTIDGDLAKIEAGDSFSTPAISRLSVYSLGEQGTATLAAADKPAAGVSVESKILGPIGAILVTRDVKSFMHVIGAEFGTIGLLKIGGALQGGNLDTSGVISVSGRITTATIGSIVGGTKDSTGLLLGSFFGNSSLGNVTVTDGIIGGNGEESGAIEAPRIGNVTVGKLTGGSGRQSAYIFSNSTLGNVTVTGDLAGGGGEGAGQIAANTGIGAVKIGGNVTGGNGADSGSIRTAGSILSLNITGTLKGGVGEASGRVETLAGGIGTVTIGAAGGESIIGGSGADSGGLAIKTNISSLTTKGSVRGGTGNGSGGIVAGGNIDKLVIGGSLVGGDSPAGAFLNKSGFISALRIKSVMIADDILSGVNGGGGIANSGAIRADVIDSLTVKGDVTGNNTVTNDFSPVLISGTGLTNNVAIRSINIGGDVKFAEILAGYNDAASKDSNTGVVNFRGIAKSADASIGTITIGGTVRGVNIVAGAKPGADGRFGTADDRLLSGSSIIDDPDAIATIASVIIKGGLPATQNPAFYGIVAQHIVSIQLGTPAQIVPLQAGAFNDVAVDDNDQNPGLDLTPAGAMFRALELPKLPLA